MDRKRVLPDNPQGLSSEECTIEEKSDNYDQQENEPTLALAIGLPSWSIEPPLAVVRRKARVL